MADKDLKIKISADAADAQKNIDGLAESIDGLGDKSQKAAQGGLEKLTYGLFSLSVIRGLVGQLAGMGKELIGLSDQYNQLAARIGLYTESQEEANAILGQLGEIARGTHASLDATSELFVRLQAATKGTGTSQQELLQVTGALNNALRVSGAGAAEAKNALIQLSQGLASGTLRGDEFNSVAEQMPVLLDALGKATGKTRGELREFAAQGSITADLVKKAVLDMAQEWEEQAASMPVTLEQSITDMKSAWMEYIGTSDLAKSSSEALASTISTVAGNLGEIGAALQTAGFAAAAVAVGKLTGAMQAYSIKLTEQAAQTRLARQAVVDKAQAEQDAARIAQISAKAVVTLANEEVAAKQRIAAATRAQLAAAQQELAMAKELSVFGERRAAMERNLTAAKAAHTAATAGLVEAEGALAVASRASTAAAAQAAAAHTATTAAIAATGVAARTAAAAVGAFRSVVAFLGGPAGAIMTAVTALMVWNSTTKSTKEVVDEAGQALADLKTRFNNLSRLEALNAIDKLKKQLEELKKERDSFGAWDAIWSGLTGDTSDLDAVRAKIDQIDSAITALEGHAKSLEPVQSALSSLTTALKGTAEAYTRTAETSERMIKTVKLQGEAAVTSAQASARLIETTGDLTRILQAKAEAEQAEARAAQDNADASRQAAEQTRARITQIEAEIEALGRLAPATQAEQDLINKNREALEQQIATLGQLLLQQDAQTGKLDLLAQAQAEQARTAALATQTFGDQSAKLDELYIAFQNAQAGMQSYAQNAAEVASIQAQIAEKTQLLIDLETLYQELLLAGGEGAEAHRALIEQTRAELEAMNAALEEASAKTTSQTEAAKALADAQTLLKDAIKDSHEAMQAQMTLSQGQMQLDMKAIDLKQVEAQKRLAVAKARGDEKGIQQAQHDLAQLEIERINVLIKAKEREAEVVRKKVELARMEAELDGIVTEQERRQIEIAEQKLAIVESEIDMHKAAAAAKEEVIKATERATEAERKHGQVVRDTADAIRDQADAKDSASKDDTSKMKGGGRIYMRMPGESEAAYMKRVEDGEKFNRRLIRDAQAKQAYEAALERQETTGWERELEDLQNRQSRPSQPQQTQVQPTRVVRFELSSPSGQRATVDALPGSEAALESWLKSLETGRRVAQ